MTPYEVRLVMATFGGTVAVATLASCLSQFIARITLRAVPVCKSVVRSVGTLGYSRCFDVEGHAGEHTCVGMLSWSGNDLPTVETMKDWIDRKQKEEDATIA